MLEQVEGHGAGAADSADVVGVSVDWTILPLTGVVLPLTHNLALPVLHVHRSLQAIPAKHNTNSSSSTFIMCHVLYCSASWWLHYVIVWSYGAFPLEGVGRFSLVMGRLRPNQFEGTTL